MKYDALSWYKKSVETKKTYGLSETVFITCDSLKRMWRNAHPETVSFWYELEDIVRRAIASPGSPSLVVSLKLDAIKHGYVSFYLRVVQFATHPHVMIMGKSVIWALTLIAANGNG